jgi:pre-mRNA-splicing factor 18
LLTMDFASLMSAQIDKGKSGSSSTSESQRYQKRSELEAQREAAYLAEQEAREKLRKEKLEKKRKLEDEEAKREAERKEKRRRLAEESRKQREEEEEAKEKARRKKLGLPDLPSKAEINSQEGTPVPESEDIPETELVQKLRELGEPIRLFGESHKQRLRRYRKLCGRDATPAPVLTDGPIPTYLELVPEAEMKIDKSIPKDDEKRKYLYRQLASYFTMVLKEWERAMARRDESVKLSYTGKQAYNAMVHAKDNLRPFFKKMELNEIDNSVLEPVVEIVHAAQERRYVDANDAYLRTVCKRKTT